MAYTGLADFVETLDQAGELLRIKLEVSPELEVAEITDRVSKSKDGGPALLFENVAGSEMPLLINAFGSYQRMSLALGVKDIQEVAEEIGDLIKIKPPQTIFEKVQILSTLSKLTKFPPKQIRNGSCQEIVLTEEKIDLDKIPIIKCWPEDGGKYVTLPQVITKGLEHGDRNIGMYRMQKIDQRTFAMHWQIHHDGAKHCREYSQAGKRMPVAVAIGGDPVMTYAATAPLPTGIEEFLFAGFLHKSNVTLVKCKTIDLSVPADADIVFEGYIEPNETCLEGPFGDHTGYYNEVEQFPIFTVKRVTHRKNPIYHSTYTGRPPDEPAMLGMALNEVFVPLLQKQFPEIVDFYLPPEGCSYRLAVVSIKKQYPGHAKRIMMGIWSFLRQFMYTKFIVVVDDDIDTRKWEDVIWAITTRMDPIRDTVLIDNTPIDYLDFASPVSGLGSKMGLDATNKLQTETKRTWGTQIEMSPKVKERIDHLWKELGISD